MNPLTRPTHGMLPRRKRGLVFSLAIGRGFFFRIEKIFSSISGVKPRKAV